MVNVHSVTENKQTLIQIQKDNKLTRDMAQITWNAYFILEKALKCQQFFQTVLVSV